MEYFRAYLINRETKRDNSGDYIIVEFRPLSGKIPAEDAPSALAKAQELHPLFPHRLAVEEHGRP